ncbi:hypothetical protein pb186bvf_000805 [Paramecium bursaria]
MFNYQNALKSSCFESRDFKIIKELQINKQFVFLQILKQINTLISNKIVIGGFGKVLKLKMINFSLKQNFEELWLITLEKSSLSFLFYFGLLKVFFINQRNDKYN